MNSNNSTVDVSCPNLDWYTKVGQRAQFIDNYISSPINIILSIFMYGLYLKAFYTQVKKENGYAYQIIVTINDILVMVTSGFYLINFHWLANPNGPIWYRTCYSCMWLGTVVISAFLNTVYTWSIFLAVCMSADRLYALWKPLSYKITNIERNVILSISISSGLAVFFNLMSFSVYTVQQTGQNVVNLPVYTYIYNPNRLAQIFATFRTIIQTVCIPILYFSNIALIRFYRIRKIEAATALNLTSKEKEARRVQKTLTLLSICQCIWMTIQITFTSAVQFAMYLFPSSYKCSGLLYMPIREIILQIFYTANVFTVPIISKPFRKMLYEELPCYKKEGTVAGAGAGTGAGTGAGAGAGAGTEAQGQNHGRLRQPARQVW